MGSINLRVRVFDTLDMRGQQMASLVSGGILDKNGQF